jgi:hypothetical protein
VNTFLKFIFKNDPAGNDWVCYLKNGSSPQRRSEKEEVMKFIWIVLIVRFLLTLVAGRKDEENENTNEITRRVYDPAGYQIR